MTSFGVGVLAGAGLGPLIADFIYSNPHLGWRYSHYPSNYANSKLDFLDILNYQSILVRRHCDFPPRNKRKRDPTEKSQQTQISNRRSDSHCRRRRIPSPSQNSHSHLHNSSFRASRNRTNRHLLQSLGILRLGNFISLFRYSGTSIWPSLRIFVRSSRIGVSCCDNWWGAWCSYFSNTGLLVCSCTET